jgi:hypothetical protein
MHLSPVSFSILSASERGKYRGPELTAIPVPYSRSSLFFNKLDLTETPVNRDPVIIVDRKRIIRN